MGSCLEDAALTTTGACERGVPGQRNVATGRQGYFGEDLQQLKIIWSAHLYLMDVLAKQLIGVSWEDVHRRPSGFAG